MAISFACPSCGKTFEQPESNAGKKARCKQCGTVFEIPRPAPARRPKPETSIYDLDDDPDGAVLSGPATRRSKGVGSVPEGTRIDLLAVTEWSPDRLTLTAKTTRLLLISIGGFLALIAGMFLISMVEHGIANAQGPVRIPIKLLFIPFGLTWAGVFGICCGARLGSQLTFDRDSAALAVRRFLIWDTTWMVEDLDRIVFVVLKPQHKNMRGPNNPQACEAYVVDRDGRAVAMIERVASHNPESIQPLVQICLHASDILGIPVAVDQRGELMSPEVRRAVETLEAASNRRRTSLAPTFRKPLVTYHSVGVALATTVMLVGFGRFMMKWSELGQDLADAVAGPAEPDGDAAPEPGRPPAVAKPARPARAQGKARGHDEMDRLMSDVASDDGQKRRIAYWRLETRDPGPRRDELLKAATASLEARNAREREAAVKVLGAWGTDEDFARLIARVDDPDDGVRNAAADVLAKRKSVEGAEAVARRLHDPRDRFGMAIRLRRFGPAAAPVMARLLDDPDDEVKLEAANVLAEVATRDQLEALRAAYDHYKQVTGARFGVDVSPHDRAAMARFHFAHRIVHPLERAIRTASSRAP